jgi:hypothetical protein
MRTTILFIPVVSLMIFASIHCNAQIPSTNTNKTSTKTIWDIPHKTIWQKWMWIHRSTVKMITKDHSVNYDTSYIKSYYKRLVITLPVSTRLLKFSLLDLNSGNKLIFAPNLQYNLGISISSRWMSFIINTGIKVINYDTDTKGNTKYQDYQINLYGRKITTSSFVQYYSGYYIKNSKSYPSYVSETPYAVRADINALNIGVNSMYILNHRKLSIGSSFGFVEQQKKSAGSFLLGLYYFYFEANGSPSLVTLPFRNSFDTLSYIHSVRINNFGLNLGYIYTLVFLKKCYATGSVVQGLGGKIVNYKGDDYSTNHNSFGGAGNLNLRLALGYDNGRYIVGAMGMIDYFLFSEKSDPTVDYSFGKFTVYVGYRFSILRGERKLLHNLNLIDFKY